MKTNDEIYDAFRADGLTPVGVKTVFCNGNQGRGILAKTTTNRTRDGEQVEKKVIYVEGTNYQMGFLIGELLEKEISIMTSTYMENIIPDFLRKENDFIFKMLLWAVKNSCWNTYSLNENMGDIPQELHDEMRGMAAGCKEINPHTRVSYENLFLLNVGIDFLVAVVYTNAGLARIRKDYVDMLPPGERDCRIETGPNNFRLPLGCNAFAAFKNATKNKHFYFGRDFQFSNAKVFQDLACIIIYNPQGDQIPLVSQTAPGFVGSITGMNRSGVAMGVDMVPSVLCDPMRPGIGSLLMVRHALSVGKNAQSVVDAIVDSQRGASWLYPVGDGSTNTAVIVESGQKDAELDPHDYLARIPRHGKVENILEKARLPEIVPSNQGLYERWNDWKYPSAYLNCNKDLFNIFGYIYNENMFGVNDMINKSWIKDDNVHEGLYFHPQREQYDDLVVVSNMFLIPEMRICAMHRYTNELAVENMADIIWRYDTLNRECLEVYGEIDWDAAKTLIDFLNPQGKYGAYYGGSEKEIKGSVSLCDLTDKIMTSHFGYYSDDWVTIHLSNYI